MKHRMIAVLLCLMLVCGLSACTKNKNEESLGDTSQILVSEAVQEDDTMLPESDDMALDTEQTAETVPESEGQDETVSGDGNGAAGETGNFNGLEVEDEINIEINEGEKSVGG